MKIFVELNGLARSMVGQKMLEVNMEEEATYQDIIRFLAKKYPELIGLLIDRDGETFLSSNMFIINGDLRTPAMILSEHPQEAIKLVLMSLITGG